MKKQRKARRTSPVVEDKSNIKTIKKVLKIFAFIILGIAALTPIHITPDIDGYERPDVIILDYANLLKKLMESETTLQELVINDPINELITSKLRPIQGAYSSILKQTIIYEDMMKKSGQKPGSGPANFVESSTKDLEALNAAIVLTLDLQLTEIWNAHLQKVMDDMKVWREAQQLFQYILKDGGQRRFLEWQIETNITLTNLHDLEVPTHLTVPKMQKLLDRLGYLLYEKYLKSTELKRLTDVTEASPQLDKMLHAARKELNEVLMDLSDELEENGKYYQFTYHFLMKQYTKLNEISVKIQDSSKKFEFVNLRNQLQDDILGLKDRLKRLLL